MKSLDKTLFKTVFRGKDAQKVVQLLAEGANPNALDENGYSLLQSIIHQQNIEIVEILLMHGANPNVAKGEETTLARAAATGNLTIANLLIQHGAEVNPLREDKEAGNLALFNAAYHGHEAMVELLIHHGVEVDIQSSRISLNACATNGNLRIFERLLPYFKPYLQSEFATYALKQAIYHEHQAFVLTLLAAGCSPNFTNTEEPLETPLMAAAEMGNVELIAALIAHGANLNAKDERGSALNAAVNAEKLDAIEYLLAQGIEINDDLGKEALNIAMGLATYDSRLALTKLLLTHGAVIDEIDMLNAASCKNPRLIELLHTHGGNIDFHDEDNDSPIRMSLRYDCPKVTRWLMAQGVDLPIVFADGCPAIITAALGDNGSMVGYLLGRGDDISARWPQRDIDAIMRAAEAGLRNMVELLVHHGADPKAVNKHGETAYSLAMQASRQLQDDGEVASKQLAVAEYLLSIEAALGTEAHRKPSIPKVPLLTAEDCHAIAQQLKRCMPLLDLEALLAAIPSKTITNNDTVLDWLYDALSLQQLMQYKEWKDFHGELPDALKMLSDIDVSSFDETVIEDALEEHGYPGFSEDVPYFEYQNHYLKPHGLCVVTLAANDIENIYMLFLRNDEAEISTLNQMLKKAKLRIDSFEALDLNACIKQIKLNAD
jgi:uncharacterized protein